MWLWLEFPADPERWASARSPLVSPLALGFLFVLLLYYMGIVHRFIFLCNLFYTFLFIFVLICPFLLYTLVCAIFLLIFFLVFCIFLYCLTGQSSLNLLHVILKLNSAYVVSLNDCGLKADLVLNEEHHRRSNWVQSGEDTFWHVCAVARPTWSTLCQHPCFCLPRSCREQRVQKLI